VGTYVAGTALTGANTFTLIVTVTTVGTRSVNTGSAVNGITFSGTGTFAATGAQTITLTGTGTPTTAGTNTFTVTGGTATCTFQCTTAVVISDYFPRTTNSNELPVYDVFIDSLLTKVIPNTYYYKREYLQYFMSTDGTVPGFDSTASGQYARQEIRF
jgi:hypothetical protein